MLTIEKSSEYKARAIKNTDFDNEIPGYNFSYPVINTVEICNLMIIGGSIDITMNGQSKSTWSFDKENLVLSINKEKHYIADTKELGKAMIQYFDDNKLELMQKNLNTNLKKSQSKNGNQNAKKIQNIETSSLLSSEITNTKIDPYKLSDKNKRDYQYDIDVYSKYLRNTDLTFEEIKKEWNKLPQ